MKKMKIIMVSIATLLVGVSAQASGVQRCVDSSGNVTYSSSSEKGMTCEKTDIEKKVMQITNHGGTGFAPSSPVLPSKSSNTASAPSTVSIPKITSEEQKKKDVNRIAILENELKDEIESINKVEKMVANAGTDSKQINELNSMKERHMQNVKSLQREIDIQSKK